MQNASSAASGHRQEGKWELTLDLFVGLHQLGQQEVLVPQDCICMHTAKEGKLRHRKPAGGSEPLLGALEPTFAYERIRITNDRQVSVVDDKCGCERKKKKVSKPAP